MNTSSFAKHLSRRSFINTLGFLAGGAAAARIVPLSIAEAAHQPKATETRLTMGTMVTITALAPSRDQAQNAIGRAFECMDNEIGVFDRYSAATALSSLNEHGRIDNAPEELLLVLQRAAAISRISSGAFDASVAPVVDLLKTSNGRPDKADLRQALELVGAEHIKINGRSIRLQRSGMRLTLDGIAKGRIADQAARVLFENGVTDFLVNAGGDIRVSGSPAGKKSWRIAVQDPDKHNDYPDVLDITQGALATSGGYEIYFDPAGRSHHLVDPENGHSPNGVASVSVQAPSVMEADALATTLALVTPAQAMRLVDSLPHRECLLVTSNGDTIRSRGWGRATV